MEKDFERWNKNKKYLDTKTKNTFCHEREIWWCSLGVNIGSEIHGKGKQFARPVFILRKFSVDSFWAIPLTTKTKTGSYFFKMPLADDAVARWAVLNQMRFVDTKRLFKKGKICTVSKKEAENIKKAVEGLLPLTAL